VRRARLIFATTGVWQRAACGRPVSFLAAAARAALASAIQASAGVISVIIGNSSDDAGHRA
jgi:hypothetical protein